MTGALEHSPFVGCPSRNNRWISSARKHASSVTSCGGSSGWRAATFWRCSGFVDSCESTTAPSLDLRRDEQRHNFCKSHVSILSKLPCPVDACKLHDWQAACQSSTSTVAIPFVGTTMSKSRLHNNDAHFVPEAKFVPKMQAESNCIQVQFWLSPSAPRARLATQSHPSLPGPLDQPFIQCSRCHGPVSPCV
jgi:hypothetical protein